MFILKLTDALFLFLRHQDNKIVIGTIFVILVIYTVWDENVAKTPLEEVISSPMRFITFFCEHFLDQNNALRLEHTYQCMVTNCIQMVPNND